MEYQIKKFISTFKQDNMLFPRKAVCRIVVLSKDEAKLCFSFKPDKIFYNENDQPQETRKYTVC